MDIAKQNSIARAKELLKTVRNASMATVNNDGSPHNTPFYFLYDDKLTHIYWGSHPASEHSKNVLRTGQLFVVLYDAMERGGLYIQADHGKILEGKELEDALKIHNKSRAKDDRDALDLSFYIGKSPQRMWSAEIKTLWVNGTERSNGHIIRDIREEISAEDLLA